MNVDNTCFFTGHRIIKKEHINLIKDKLKDMILKLCDEGVHNFIAGGALGFDTLSALSVLEAKKENPNISLILALPCKDQNRHWSKKDSQLYERILKEADKTVYVSEEYYNGCMQKRNRYMADNSSHCIFYLSSMTSGTAYTVKYALEKGIEMHNIMETDE